MPITLMASSSSSSSSASASIVPFLLRSPTSAPSRSIPNSIRAQISPNPNPNPNKKPLLLLLRLLKPAATATATATATAAAAASASLSLSLALALTPTPALAEQMEKAALFDFNLTLPAIALEFLLLMVALDRIYFTPLGNFMQDRDAAIRAQLGDVKDTSGEVKQLEEQSAAVMKAARAEISAALNKMKKETAAELEQKLAQGKSKVEAELAEALADLQRQKEETLSALDSQIRLLADEIVSKVLPPAA